MGKLIDRTGQRYGRLVVINKAETDIHGNAKWLCLCDCGNQVVVSGNALQRGTKSCGCYMREVARERKTRDLRGLKFGRLLPIRIDHKDKKNNNVWECICDCGNTTYVPASLLITGHTKSCGCLQREFAGTVNYKDLTGQKFGRLTVNERVGSNKTGQALWKCTCECGNTTVVSSASLISYRICSCGCLKSKGEQRIQKWLEEHGIIFEKEYCFADCRDVAPLPFDFFLPSVGENGGCIEYDGIQHFKDSKLYSTNVDLNKRKERDKYKTEYCYKHDIKILRISYLEFDNIESILPDWLFLNGAEDANSSDADPSA